MKHCLGIVVACLTSVLLVATDSHAKEPVRLGKLSCVVVKDGWVYPLQGRVEGPGRIRCSVQVTFSGKEQLRLPMTLTLGQAAEARGNKPIHVQSKTELYLESGSAELDVSIPNELNGCMPFSLTMQVGAQKKSKTNTADCGEG